ncbi:MAG: hypothetical protein RSC28_09205 [Bacteroidales bacterium]
MKKSFLLFLLFFSGLFQVYSQEQLLKWIPFQWQGDTISGKYIEKAYIYVPVKIDELPVGFTMQLDLGTQDTQFYGNPIKPFLAKYPSLANKLDSIYQKQNLIFRDVNLQMGGASFLFDVWHRIDFGEEIPQEILPSKAPIHIGTIAPDLFKDKILILDYKRTRFAVLDELPTEYRDLPTVAFELINGMIVFPFQINGIEQKVMFDTGSSPFPLATSKARAMEIAHSKIVDSLSGPLWWGQDITFYGLKVNSSIKFAGTELEKAIVYYDKEGLWEQHVFKPLTIWGLTGNVYFLNKILIVDYKSKTLRIKSN